MCTYNTPSPLYSKSAAGQHIVSSNISFICYEVLVIYSKRYVHVSIVPTYILWNLYFIIRSACCFCSAPYKQDRAAWIARAYSLIQYSTCLSTYEYVSFSFLCDKSSSCPFYPCRLHVYGVIAYNNRYSVRENILFSIYMHIAFSCVFHNFSLLPADGYFNQKL